ncbi:MAG: pyruvate formate lyase family protein [Candidatus Poribacteria bacterium]
MTEDAILKPKLLSNLHEFFASGYFEEPDASPMLRWSRAVRRRFENRKMMPYNGELLYPCGPTHIGGENYIVAPSYSFTYSYNEGALMDVLADAIEDEREALLKLQTSMRDLGEKLDAIRTPHTVGGRGYTHSVPNYGRVVREGLSEHARRIDENLAVAQQRDDTERIEFYTGLKDVLAGIECWHRRILEFLRHTATDNPVGEKRRKRLIAAYEQAPFHPARDFFEALVAYNFVYYLDDCDNPGRVDLELFPYYERDLQAGRITHDEAVDLIRCLWENSDANNGWSAGIGGTTPTGEAAYSDLTVACLEAAHKIRRPNLQLHIRRDMPQEVWDAALDAIATGCGLPALYNEEEYLRSLRDAHLGVREEDLAWHNGGGCTETMIHGRSNVGSLDAGINLPLILVQTLQENLAAADSFDELVTAYKKDVADVVSKIADDVSADQEVKSRLRPQPMRSLLIDDCIDNGREFNAGGARYNWSVINVAGLANTIDSLAAVREIVFEQKEKTGAELLEILQNNYAGEEAFRQRLTLCPRFGNDDVCADDIAVDISEFVFSEFLRYAPWRGGKFLASCLMFVTYAGAGEPVGATPDGRFAGAPLADSAGPYQGRDKKGPTAMLKSVAAMPHYLAPGTLVVNARFTKDFFTTDEGRAKIQDLVRTYFDMGGMQLQINVVDQSVLRDAIAHPEQYKDLIIRVGGYSEYFNRLSPALKQTVLERTEHGL